MLLCDGVPARNVVAMAVHSRQGRSRRGYSGREVAAEEIYGSRGPEYLVGTLLISVLAECVVSDHDFCPPGVASSYHGRCGLGCG